MKNIGAKVALHNRVALNMTAFPQFAIRSNTAVCKQVKINPQVGCWQFANSLERSVNSGQ